MRFRAPRTNASRASWKGSRETENGPGGPRRSSRSCNVSAGRETRTCSAQLTCNEGTWGNLRRKGMTMGRPDDSLEPDSCMRCGHRMSVVEETPLDVAGQDVVLVRERCTNCEWEAISAPSILRSDHDLLPAFEPGKTPIGRDRRVGTP